MKIKNLLDLKELSAFLIKILAKEATEDFEYVMVYSDYSKIDRTQTFSLSLREKNHHNFWLVVQGIVLQDNKDSRVDVTYNMIGQFFEEEPNKYIHSDYQNLRMMLCVHKDCTTENLEILMFDKIESIRKCAKKRLIYRRSYEG